MSLRLFCDQCVPAEISDALRNQGFDVILLRSVLPIPSPDTAVIAKAQQLAPILLSLNGDFSHIVAYPPENHAGIIAIQLNNHPGDNSPIDEASYRLSQRTSGPELLYRKISRG